MGKVLCSVLGVLLLENRAAVAYPSVHLKTDRLGVCLPFLTP